VTDQSWIEWTGGECPVSVETEVEIKLRCGDTNGCQPAGLWASGFCDWWKHEPSIGAGHRNDIIAYRVVQS